MRHNAVRAADVEDLGLEGSRFTVCCPGGSICIRVPAPGRHMVMNALCAIGVGLSLGMEMEQISRGIEGYVPLSGRMHIQKCRRVTLLSDAYNASPTSMRGSIDIAAKAQGRCVLILGDMLELGESSAEYHSQMGRYAAGSGAGLVITLGSLAENIHLAAKENGVDTAHFDSHQSLMEGLQGLLMDGDTVLVKASAGMKLGAIAQYIQDNF